MSHSTIMKLTPVSKRHYKFLYELLKEKEQYQNISHKEMPTWEEHVEFNDLRPYKLDMIILDGEPIGRVYLTKANEIGIHIKKGHRGAGVGGEVVDKFLKMCEGDVFANISPKNKGSQKFFKRKGFKLIQYTYKWSR